MPRIGSAQLYNDGSSVHRPQFGAHPHKEIVSNFTKATDGRSLGQYDWAHHMPTIKRLYVDEKRNLKDVKEIMEREYGFRAT